MRFSKRAAWCVASAAGAIALLEAAALVLLTPLKSVEPYTLLVDKTTGYVQALEPLDQQRISPDSALTQSFLVQYVIAREGFDTTSLESDYRKAALFSAGEARSSYLHSMQASNPDSPLRLYPRSTILGVRIKSVSPIGANSALVRFDTTRTDASGAQQPASSWVGVIKYRYSTDPMKIEDRFINPLGFQVTDYRKDPETAPPPSASTSAPAPESAALPSYYFPSPDPAVETGVVK